MYKKNDKLEWEFAKKQTLVNLKLNPLCYLINTPTIIINLKLMKNSL